MRNSGEGLLRVKCQLPARRLSCARRWGHDPPSVFGASDFLAYLGTFISLMMMMMMMKMENFTITIFEKFHFISEKDTP
jgi:hypothetical protein